MRMTTYNTANMTGMLRVIALLTLLSVALSTEQSLSVHLDSSKSHDFCISDQNCLNGVVCRVSDEDSNVKHCHCPDGVTGQRCEHYCPLQCQNQGYCYTVQKAPSFSNDHSAVLDVATFSFLDDAIVAATRHYRNARR